MAYSLRVWLTGVLLGPIVMIFGGMTYLYISRYNAHSGTSAFAFRHLDWPPLQVWVGLYLSGLIVLIPNFLLFWMTCFAIHKRAWPVRIKKLALTILTLLLVAATTALLDISQDWPWWPTLLLSMSYFLPLLFGIYFHLFPEPKVDPVFDF